jgi:F-type H+-transporting ATPase subunit b
MWFLLAQDHGGGHADPGINPTDIGHHANIAAAVWAWVIFVVLVALLWKFAWGPIAKGLEARAHRISESLKKAEEIEKATRELAETNRKTMEAAQQQAQGIVAEARTAAKHAADEVVKKAHADIEAQRERFTRETQLAIDKARADLRRETVDLTIAATTKLLGRSLTDADNRRLAEQALSDAESVRRN